MDEPREVVEWFAERMEEQLRANDHKSGWDADDAPALLARLREETDELAATFDENGRAWHNPERTVKEAADVANFAMMIADNAAPRPTNERRAGLSPIARTAIADARAAFAVVWGWVSCGPKIAPDDVYEASGRVFKALDSVLGAESTKETK